MSISTKDRGNTTGELSLHYSLAGTRPSSGPDRLVLLQMQTSTNSPFGTFCAPTSTELAAYAELSGCGADAARHQVHDVVSQVNAIADNFLELDGPVGCVKDRICHCFPPWVCFLPLICCLGGFCLVTAHTKTKVLKFTAEINAKLVSYSQSGNGGGIVWQLCSGAHESKIEMSLTDRQAHSDMGNSSKNFTHIDTLVWLEARSSSYQRPHHLGDEKNPAISGMSR